MVESYPDRLKTPKKRHREGPFPLTSILQGMQEGPAAVRSTASARNVLCTVSTAAVAWWWCRAQGPLLRQLRAQPRGHMSCEHASVVSVLLASGVSLDFCLWRPYLFCGFHVFQMTRRHTCPAERSRPDRPAPYKGSISQPFQQNPSYADSTAMDVCATSSPHVSLVLTPR